jgi:hypothetical protein
VGPLLLGAAGVVALGVAAAILRSFGPRYRVGRLLAVVPVVPVREAVRIAAAGEQRYVRVDGRIDSDEEFEDEHHRPLVLRRTTFEWHPAKGEGGHSGDDFRWRPLGEPRLELAPFVVREELDEIGVDAARLGAGLIVIPRISEGKVGDLGDIGQPEVQPDGDARMTVEQVSSVEHATVLGVPTRGADGTTVIGPGMGRPLILTTLERDEAMRVLTGGAMQRSRVAIACLAIGAALLALAVAWWFVASLVGGGVATALAATPDPSLIPGTDIRTGNDAPGFVGNPAFAILGVGALGVVSVAGTLAWIRLTGGRGGRRGRPRP